MSSNKVIDNYNGNDLAKYLNDVLPYCESGKFAIGYFFTSGFDIIIEKVKDLKELRILISNTTDQKTAETLLEGFKRLSEVNRTLDPNEYLNKPARKRIVQDTSDNLKEGLGRMKQEDSEEKTIITLLDLMSPEKQTVKFRVLTKEKLHAKAYLLKARQDTDFRQIIKTEGYGIVGSSNLSISGLQHSSELNLVTFDKQDYEHISNWFDRLWDEADEFTDDFKLILANSWAAKPFSPYDVYVKGMYHEAQERLGVDPDTSSPFGEMGPNLLDYQLHAVYLAARLLEKYRGIFLSDVVGLGKTFVTAGILKILKMRNDIPTLVICPPVLLQMWKSVLGKYGIDAQFLSRGMLSKSESDLFEYEFSSRKLIIIDESHHFRHSSSKQYKNLKKYLDEDEDRKVILITATPMGTSMVDDICNQIKLFHKTDTLTIPVGPTSLNEFIKEVKESTNEQARLRDLLGHIMIRRRRQDVLNDYGVEDKETGRKCLVNTKTKERIFFPERELDTLNYDIQSTFNGQYDRILDLLERKNLKLARFGLGMYIKKDRMGNNPIYTSLSENGRALIGLMRMLLLKRLESSIIAFQKTVKKMLFINKVFYRAIKEGFIPYSDLTQKTLYEFAGDSDINDTIVRKNIDNLNIEKERTYRTIINELKKFKTLSVDDFNENELRNDLEQDIKIFEELYDMVRNIDRKNDDKFKQLIKELKTETNEKILIFSEYSDTAKYIKEGLKDEFPHDKIQFIDSDYNRKDLERIIRRFAPDANSPLTKDAERNNPIRLLVSTDIASEGTNLQDAGIIINYDIHWNFVRLIQRAGRIDRIGQKKAVIYIKNFLPNVDIDKNLQLHDRVSHCINDYMKVIGDDNQILEKTEKIDQTNMTNIYVHKNADILEPVEEFLEDKSESELNKIKQQDPEHYNSILKMQNGIRTGYKMATSNTDRDLIVVALQAGTFKQYYKIDDRKQVEKITWTKMKEFLKVNKDITTPLKLPEYYNEHVKIAFNTFEKIVDENRASRKLPKKQESILNILRKLSRTEHEPNLEKINRLIEYFKKENIASSLITKLGKLQSSYDRGEISDSGLIAELYNIADRYPKESASSKELNDIPTILYSKYVRMS